MKLFTQALIVLGLSLVIPPAEAQVNCEAGIEFYANGGIKSCVLTGNHQVYTQQGVRIICAHGTTMALHPDGKLKSCSLKEAQRFEKQQCAAGTRAEFDGNGRLLACRPG